MIAEKLMSTCLEAWKVRDLSKCEPLGLNVETWIATLTALAGIILFLVRKLKGRGDTSSISSLRINGALARSRFRNICRAIKPIMDENYRIFSRFGPNSGAGDGSPKLVRYELGVWYKARQDIAQNNMRIRGLIAANLDAIPHQYKPIFNQWLDHIDAFSAHIADPAVDYRSHQFPQEASEIVRQYA